jgi:hypothetical protein
VYVATGVYSENVSLKAGIGIYGGYSGDFTLHDPIVFETAILGQAPTVSKPGAVSATNLTATGSPTTIIDGFTIFGPNLANTPGANSYAVYLYNVGSSVAVTNNRIIGNARRQRLGRQRGHLGLRRRERRHRHRGVRRRDQGRRWATAPAPTPPTPKAGGVGGALDLRRRQRRLGWRRRAGALPRPRQHARRPRRQGLGRQGQLARVGGVARLGGRLLHQRRLPGRTGAASVTTRPRPTRSHLARALPALRACRALPGWAAQRPPARS